MVCARKAGSFGVHENIVSNDGFALDLHRMVIASAAKIPFDDVDRLACGAIHRDTRVLRVVNVVLGNEVSPRALFDFDPVPLITKAIVNVIQRDYTLAHDVLTIVRTEIHPFPVSASVMVVVASEKEASRIGAVCAQVYIGSMMNVASIDPDIAALPQSQPMTPSRNLHTSQAKILHWAALPDIHHILPGIWTCDDDLCSFLGNNPDGSIGGTTDSNIPHPLDAVGTRGNLQLIAWLQCGYCFHE